MIDRGNSWVAVTGVVLLLGLLCWPSAGQEPAGEPDAASLLRGVRAGLPRKDLRIEGVLSVVRRKGIEERSYQVRAELRLGRTPASALYTICDAFGVRLEEMEITQVAGSLPSIVYRTGEPPVEARAPDAGSGIQGTDISWLDLSMSYLWWTNAVLIGKEVFRGQACRIVQVWAPDRVSDVEGAYHWVRLWVADSACAVLKAEGYSRAGVLLRRMEADSVRKIGGQWMVKDLEISGTDSTRRTRIVVDKLEELGQAAGAVPSGGGGD